MNNQDQNKVNSKSENNEMKSVEMVQNKPDENQILKDNYNPNEITPVNVNNNHVEIPIQPEVEVGKNNKNQKVKTYEGTVSPYKNQIREKKKPRELEFKWKDLVISAKVDKNCCTKYDPEKDQEKVLLNNVSGKVSSGEMLAIIGASGAGKTTLLNFLSGKTESPNLNKKGEILLNNQPISPQYYDMITSYVMQDDVLEQTMTPLEILLFTAKMKLNLPIEEIEKRVQKMIFELNLYKCRNTRIGNEIERGVSGGERKRTSIAVELISDPKIIFLDEPTTGLDSFNAYQLINNLNNLAIEENKLIIFTIHQPSSEIYELLDKLLILANGKNIFFGDKNEAYTMFNINKLPVPNNYNPFEYFLEITTITSIERPDVQEAYPKLKDFEQDDLKGKYSYYCNTLANNFDEFRNNEGLYLFNLGKIVEEEELTEINEDIKRHIMEKIDTHSFFFEFWMLLNRQLIICLRNKLVLANKIGQSIIVGALIAIIWNNITNQQSGIQDRIGVLFISMANPIFGTISAVLLIFADERKVLVRERTNHLYSLSSYYFSKILMDFPHLFTGNCIFAMIIYLSTRLNDVYSYKYFVFLGLTNFISFVGSSYGYFIGTLGKTKESLTALNPMLTVPLLVLSGFFTDYSNYAPYLIPFYYISPFRYGYETFVINEFNDAQPLYCNQKPGISCKPLSLYKFPTDMTTDLLIVTGLIVAYNLLAFFMLYKTAKLSV